MNFQDIFSTYSKVIIIKDKHLCKQSAYKNIIQARRYDVMAT